MAITLFKPEKEERRFLAVEKLNLLYNLLTTILVIIFYERLQDPQAMLMGRFAILAGTLVIVYVYTRWPSEAMRLVRIVAQMSLLSYWYPDTFEFNRIFPNLDHLFASLEQSLFACQPSILFENICSGYWWREAFNMGYWSYYPMIVTVTLWYFFKKKKEIERCTFIIIASFYIYYLIYIFVPVAGPQFYFPVIGDELVASGAFPEIGNYFDLHPQITIPQADKDGLFTSLVNMAQASGERPTAAFPSSHIGISTILMILAIRAKKSLAAILFPLYILLCCATVYIKAHYLVDAFAGLLSGILLYIITAFIFDRWLKGEEKYR
ncbi:MAG: phosphatase PAP2 family protein [Bacteroidaceae bacterium]|nr:phosphatase PAP2 family protein [Bacteroidaceae bacterium]